MVLTIILVPIKLHKRNVVFLVTLWVADIAKQVEVKEKEKMEEEKKEELNATWQWWVYCYLVGNQFVKHWYEPDRALDSL